MSALSWCEIDIGALAGNARTLKSLFAGGVPARADGEGQRLRARAGACGTGVPAGRRGLAVRERRVRGGGAAQGRDPGSALRDGLRAARGRRGRAGRSTAAWWSIAATSWTGPRRRARATAGPGGCTSRWRPGTSGRGCADRDALELARRIHDSPHLELEGVASHYANIEDTTDHTFARGQLRRFNEFLDLLGRAGIHVPLPHLSNSAAVICGPTSTSGWPAWAFRPTACGPPTRRWSPRSWRVARRSGCVRG